MIHVNIINDLRGRDLVHLSIEFNSPEIVQIIISVK